MTADSFWDHCHAALNAHRQKRREDTALQLRLAADAITTSQCDPYLISRRQQHLNLIREHVTGAPPTLGVISHINCGTTTPTSLTMLRQRIARLEQDKKTLGDRLRKLPSIDSLCIIDPALQPDQEPAEEFGIILFGHTRSEELEAVLESLKRQDALQYTEVWLDGHQGKESIKLKLAKVIDIVKRYDVKRLRTQNGNFAFRKMLLLGLAEMSRSYRDILVLEDDCFPTRDAVAEFRRTLDVVRDDPRIFSVYGHHFLVPAEGETCSRFQGWGWATTSRKLRPVLRQLIDCYSMTEDRFLEFVRLTLTDAVRAQIDVTPPRQPSKTLERFFAWDETLGLLAALNGQVHKPTPKRTIFNCGMGKDSTHFAAHDMFRKPPFNLITPDEVWQHF